MFRVTRLPAHPHTRVFRSAAHCSSARTVEREVGSAGTENCDSVCSCWQRARRLRVLSGWMRRFQAPEQRRRTTGQKACCRGSTGATATGGGRRGTRAEESIYAGQKNKGQRRRRRRGRPGQMRMRIRRGQTTISMVCGRDQGTRSIATRSPQLISWFLTHGPPLYFTSPSVILTSHYVHQRVKQSQTVRLAGASCAQRPPLASLFVAATPAVLDFANGIQPPSSRSSRHRSSQLGI